MWGVQVAVALIILVDATGSRTSTPTSANAQECKDPSSKFPVGVNAVVVLGHSQRPRGYDDYDHFMGVVGCFREEQPGKVCFEGVRACFWPEDLRRVTSAAATLHSISRIATSLQHHFEESTRRMWIGFPLKAPLEVKLSGTPLPTVLEVVNSRLILAGVSYSTELFSQSVEAGKYRHFMASVRTRVEMIVFMQPLCWRWAQYGAAEFRVDTRFVQAYVKRISEALARQVRQQHCAQFSWSRKCDEIEDAVKGLKHKVVPIIRLVERRGGVKAAEFQEAAELFLNGLADAAGKLAELDDGLADVALAVLAAVRRSVGRCLALLVLRQRGLTDALSLIVLNQLMEAQRETCSFEQSASASASGKKATVVYQVRTLLPFLVMVLNKHEARQVRSEADMGRDLKSIARALQSFALPEYKRHGSSGGFQRGPFQLLFAPALKTNADGKMQVKREVNTALGDLVSKATTLSNYLEQERAAGRQGAVVQLCKNIRQLLRELTEMAVAGGGTGDVNDELFLLTG